MVEIKDIQQCVNIAHEIRLTGKPNYMEARYPLKSGLNLEAWNRLLFDYPVRKLLQYLAFGFQLSLNEPETLGNKAIKITFLHCSIRKQLTDTWLRSLKLGLSLVQCLILIIFIFTALPFLLDLRIWIKRRAILDLSFPHGQSDNDNVNRLAFDNDAFTLKFPGIDNIVEKIINLEDPYLASFEPFMMNVAWSGLRRS